MAVRHKRPEVLQFRDEGHPSIRIYRRESASQRRHPAKLHAHRYFLLAYFDGGRGVVHLPSGAHTVESGHVLLIYPGELHDTSQLGDASCFIIEFTEELISEGVARSSLALPRSGPTGWVGFAGRPLHGPFLAVVPQDQRRGWQARLTRLSRELHDRSFGHWDAVRSLLQLLLVDAARLAAPSASSGRISPLVAEVFGFIDARYTDAISLRDVARAVGRSPSHLTALVRSETGLTVLEWIHERRMLEARRRLQDTDEDVGIVAERVGFSDPAYFSRLFTRAHGLSPRAWRAKRTVRDR